MLAKVICCFITIAQKDSEYLFVKHKLNENFTRMIEPTEGKRRDERERVNF